MCIAKTNSSTFRSEFKKLLENVTKQQSWASKKSIQVLKGNLLIFVRLNQENIWSATASLPIFVID